MITDGVDPQWKKLSPELGIEVIYALSPQAKGKVEKVLTGGYRTGLSELVPGKILMIL